MKRRRFFIYLRRRGAARSALLSFFLFTAAVTAGSAETALTASADPVFIRAVLDRVSAYPGQQVTLSYRLYTRKSVTGIQQLEQPPLNGLWVEDIAVDTAPKTEKLSINGRTYHVAVIKKQALFPVAAGKLTIPASVFAVSVRTPGDFPGLSGGEETLHYKTGELSLVVNPLPVAARPADFSNAVGTFSLTASVDRNTLPAGDGVSLQVKLAGHGNLKMMPDIPLPTLSGIAVFPSGRTETTFTSEDAVIGGERTWEYVLVPEAPGLHTIPPLSFSYFNADLKKYETLTTGEISLQVDGVPKGASGETPHADSGFDGARGRNDEPFIDTGETAPAAGYRPISLLRWIPAVAALLLAVIIGRRYLHKRRVLSYENDDADRARKAASAAVRKLEPAEEETGGNPRRFYDRTAETLAVYLADAFSLSAIELTGDLVRRKLNYFPIPPETIEEIIFLMRECDYRRFVGPSESPDDIREFGSRIRAVIQRLDGIPQDVSRRKSGRDGQDGSRSSAAAGRLS